MDNATKQKLKQPDQFISTTEHGIQWAQQNRQSAIAAIVALIAVILAIVGGYTWYQHRSGVADTAFGDAMETYNTPVATPGQPVPPGTKTFPTAKDRAVESSKKFAAVASQFGMLKAGKLANYFAGLSAMEAGENSTAEADLQKTASSFNGDLAALGKLALAQLYQSEGNNAKAVDLYKELAKDNRTTVPYGMAELQLAALYEAENKPEEAKKVYAEIQDKDKDAKGEPGTAAQLAKQKLNPAPALGGLPPGFGQ